MESFISVSEEQPLLEARLLFLRSRIEGRRHEELSFLEIELLHCLDRDGLGCAARDMKAPRSFSLFFEALFGPVATVRELDAHSFGEVLIREDLPRSLD